VQLLGRIVLTGMAVLVSSSGCASATDGGTGALDGYALDLVTHTGRYWEDADALGRAEEAMVRDCMRDKGYAMPPALGSEPAPRHGEVSGVDLDYRRQHGYGIAEAAATGPARQPEPPAVPPGFDQAMSGGTTVTVGAVEVTSGGCEGAARAALAGSVERWAAAVYLPDFLNDDLIAATSADPARTRARREWQACLGRYGYRFTDYDQPRAEVEKTRMPATAERRLAVADGTCLARARVIEAGIELRRAAAMTMPPQWRKNLARAAQIRRASVATADRILGAAP
jgi:hypothetical protein